MTSHLCLIANQLRIFTHHPNNFNQRIRFGLILAFEFCTVVLPYRGRCCYLSLKCLRARWTASGSLVAQLSVLGVSIWAVHSSTKAQPRVGAARFARSNFGFASIQNSSQWKNTLEREVKHEQAQLLSLWFKSRPFLTRAAILLLVWVWAWTERTSVESLGCRVGLLWPFDVG